MKITVYFLNGAVEEYNTETHYSSAGLFGSANVGVVNYTLMTDDLSRGLWLKFRYFDAGRAQEVMGMDGRGAQLMDGVMYPILVAGEIDEVAFVECDGKRILWRTGPGEPFVNGVKFTAQSDAFVDSKNDLSAITRAVDLYHQLHGDSGAALLPKKPGESETEWRVRVAESIGWDVGTLLTYVDAHGKAAGGALPSDRKRVSEVQPDLADCEGEDVMPDPCPDGEYEGIEFDGEPEYDFGEDDEDYGSYL